MKKLKHRMRMAQIVKRKNPENLEIILQLRQELDQFIPNHNIEGENELALE